MEFDYPKEVYALHSKSLKVYFKKQSKKHYRGKVSRLHFNQIFKNNFKIILLSGVVVFSLAFPKLVSGAGLKPNSSVVPPLSSRMGYDLSDESTCESEFIDWDHDSNIPSYTSDTTTIKRFAAHAKSVASDARKFNCLVSIGGDFSLSDHVGKESVGDDRSNLKNSFIQELDNFDRFLTESNFPHVTPDEFDKFTRGFNMMRSSTLRRIFEEVKDHSLGGQTFVKFKACRPEPLLDYTGFSGVIGILPNEQEVYITKEEFIQFYPLQPQKGRKILDMLSDINSARYLASGGLKNQVQKGSSFNTIGSDIQERIESIRSKLLSDEGKLLFQPGWQGKIQIQKNLNGPIFQLYSRPLWDISGSFSYNFRNHDIFLGIGKVFFQPVFSNKVGLVGGVDAGATLLPTSHYRYNGLALRAFVGVGFAI